MTEGGGGGMRVAGATALVTGANRGIGKVFVGALLAAGAARVHAAARDPAAIAATADPRLSPLRLDVTDPAQVAAAAAALPDVTLLVNNAGVSAMAPLLAAPDMAAARAEMEVNYFGTLAMCRAFAPVLARHGGGAVVNMLSVASWLAAAGLGSYAASKAAAWSLTRCLRIELRAQGTLVVAVHAGFVDTDMAAGLDVPKMRPEEVVAQALAAVEAGREEVLADARTAAVRAALGDIAALDAQMQRSWDASRRR